MALHRDSTHPDARVRLATLIAASALRRGDRHLTACALVHAHGALGTAPSRSLSQHHVSTDVVEHKPVLVAGRVGATRW
ncbi:hypothetical protein [Amycolatopsis sp. lyj-23]|uniref:hypothetical protein n=1 Tax=Amycolatopsis sp. lyj-23 TaxID=2789283 RepID=UPI00397C90C0